MKSFSWRRFAALAAGASLVGVAITGVVLFAMPQGRFGHGGKLLFASLCG